MTTPNNLGSARAGTGHYIMQKATSVILMLVLVVLACSGGDLTAAGFSYDSVRTFLTVPTNAALVVLAVVAACFHFAGHVREVIEDYVHHTGCKHGALWLVKLGALVAAISMIYSVILMSNFGGVQ